MGLMRINEISSWNKIGGKAASLARLAVEGFVVPAAFVVDSDEFDHFLLKLELDWMPLLEQIDKEENPDIKGISTKIQLAIWNTPFPEALKDKLEEFWEKYNYSLVAVRSSALGEDGEESAWPGMLDTFLYTTKETLVQHIKKCWMSCFNERVLTYRKIKQLYGRKTGMAVVIQEMVSPDFAGVAFSVDPLDGNRNKVIIEAVKGIGETLVSGEITPDYYVVNLANDQNEVVESKGEQFLDSAIVLEIAETVKKIERTFGYPVDVEWAYAKSKLNLLQARPITNLAVLENNTPSVPRVYARKFKCDQPLWDTDAGVRIFETHRHFLWNRVDYALVTYQMGKVIAFLSEEDFDKFRKYGEEHLDADKFARYKTQVKSCYEVQQKVFKLLDHNNYETLTNGELLVHFNETMEMSHFSNSLYKATNSFCTEAVFKAFFEQVKDKDVADVLIVPSDLDLTHEEQLDWEKLVQAPFSEKNALKHLKKYPLLGLNHHTLNDCILTLKERYESREQVLVFEEIKQGKKHLKQKQEAILKERGDLRPLVETIHFLSLTRIRLKNGLAGVDFFTVRLFQEIARRTSTKLSDIHDFFLLDEIRELIISGKKVSIEEQKRRAKNFVFQLTNGKLSWATSDEATALIERYLSEHFEEGDNQGIKSLKGTVACRGVAVGRVKINAANNMEQTREFRLKFNEGDILVTEMTQPQIIDVASKAGGIITDEGGMLSHAAIFARELNIPCIVGTEVATAILKEGDLVKVDGNSGEIKIIER